MPKSFCWSLLALVFLSLVSAAMATRIDDVQRIFKDPPREYSTGPLWVWNDMLTDDQIRSTLRDLAEQNVKQVWVHPRPGLMTPYLSEEWFRLWKLSLAEAERLDMNVWIYDENSYPSGFAGGWVPELMPESRGRGLTLKEANTAPKWSDDLQAVYKFGNERFENVTERVRAGEALGEGRFLVAAQVRAGNSPWHGDRCYVNLLSPGVTEKFLEVTMEPYRKQVGEHFGGRVPGVFTDEPNIRPAGGFPWSEILAAEFKKRWGYDLMEHLPSLAQPIGDWRKIRHNYFQVLHEQFVAHWAQPFYEYCASNRLAFTGHYWDHDWPDCMGVPDNMAMYAWHQLPAIDCLMNQYAEHTHSQFGNVRMVKELSSVANQLGLKHTLCEIYGAGGWDLRFEDMKRIGDWLEVLGVNILNQHLSYVTIRGARKRDHPQSFSYHAPWWDAYRVSADYFARVSAVLSQGKQVNPVLVLHPTTTAWMYQGDGAKLGPIGDSFFKLLMAMEAAQIEYDLGNEDVMARHGSVQPIPGGGRVQLMVGDRSYRHVVLPPLTETVDLKTFRLLKSLVEQGGEVLCLGEAPTRVDGAESPELAALVKQTGWRKVGHEEVLQQPLASFKIARAADDKGLLFHHRRELEDGQFLFLVNTSIESPSAGTFDSAMGSVEAWNLYTGEREPYPFETSGSGVRAKFELPPSGSLMLVLNKKAAKPVREPVLVAETIQPTAGPVIQRLEPNVLTLDYVDITAGGESKSNMYFYQANQFIWQKNGMARNPWDSAVQFKDELISRKFPAESGFTASYKFTIEGSVPKALAIVIERPDLYTITCNGSTVSAKEGDWWLDKVFGRIDIASAAKTGENVVTIKASPFTMFHELEPAYLLGDFSLKSVPQGFVVCPPAPLDLGSVKVFELHGINPDRTMWLNGGIGAGGRDDRTPWIVFDLGKPSTLSKIKVWNYNENHVRDFTGRGARRIRISAAANDSEGSYRELSTVDLERGTGRPSSADEISVRGESIRFVRIDILSNQNGVTYPAAGQPEDNGYVGLAEVAFVSEAGQSIKGVKVAQVSSELASHQRLAKCVVNGSGLGEGRKGWNAQGHPFYSAGVAYTETFDVKSRKGRYYAHLPNWYGSVAKVKVNGKAVGFIDAPPWELDVTKFIKAGKNEIEVTVVGTPKNLLGPHHGAAVLGAAWPGNFQHGPNPGPPAGDRYSTVGYGMFEPFVLVNRTVAKPAAHGLASAR